MSAHKREPNFTSSETELLTTLVKRHANILENKQTDVINNRLKEETWQKLATEFNSTSGIHPRNAKTLRAKYENIKKSLKRKYGEHRRSMYRTGGGPPQDLNLTQEEEVIMELAGPSVEGLPARFDNDMILEHKNESQPEVIAEVIVQSEDTKIVDNNCTIEVEENPKETKKGIGATTEVYDTTPNRFILKRKKSTPLRCNPIQSRNPESFVKTMGTYSDLSKKKQDLLAIQIKSTEEKNKQEKIEHELRCAQLQAKIKQDAREHELKCELMLLDIMLKKKTLNE